MLGSSCVREKVSKYFQVIVIDRLEDFGHGCIVGMPRPRLVLPECLEEIILALICESRYVFLSSKIGSMADIAVVLLGERAAARKALRIALLGGRPRRRQLGQRDRHTLQIFIAPSFRIFVHRRSNSQSLAKHKELNKGVWCRLAAQRWDIRGLRLAILAMAGNTSWQSLLGR